jgi:hypothetical protein
MYIQPDICTVNVETYPSVLERAVSEGRQERRHERGHAQYANLCELISKQLDPPWLLDFNDPEVEKRERL